MAETSDWLGPIIGLGVGIIAVNALSRATGGGNVFGSNKSSTGYSVYIGDKFHKKYRSFDSARKEADRLRHKGATGVTVFNE